MMILNKKSLSPGDFEGNYSDSSRENRGYKMFDGLRFPYLLAQHANNMSKHDCHVLLA